MTAMTAALPWNNRTMPTDPQVAGYVVGVTGSSVGLFGLIAAWLTNRNNRAIAKEKQDADGEKDYITNLRADMQGAKDEIKSLTTNLSSANDKMYSFQDQIIQNREALGLLNLEVETLRHKLDAEIDEKRRMKQEYEEEIAQLQQELVEREHLHEEERRRLQARIDELEGVIGGFRPIGTMEPPIAQRTLGQTLLPSPPGDKD